MSWFGNAMAPMALGFAILQVHGSLQAVSVVVACRSVASLAVFLLGGSLADRFDGKRLVIGASVVSAVTEVAVAAVLHFLAGPVVFLAGLNLINGASAAVAGPSTVVVYRSLVHDSDLQRANAINRLGMNVALLAGTGAGGVIVAAFGGEIAILIDAASFVVPAILVALIRTPLDPEAAAGSQAARAGLRAGWLSLARTRGFGIILLAGFVYMAAFSGGIRVLALKVAAQTFGSAGYGLVGLGQIGGGIAIGVLLAATSRTLDPFRQWTFAFLPVILLFVLLGPLVSFTILHHASLSLLALTFVLMVVAGGLFESATVSQDVWVMANIPPGQLGRGSSILAAASIAGVPVGELLAGAATGWLTMWVAFVFFAAVMAVCLAPLAIQGWIGGKRTSAAAREEGAPANGP